MHRILHIVPSLARSGTTTQLALLLAGLPKDKFELHVAALNVGGSVAADLRLIGIEAQVFDRRWPADPIAFQRLRRHIARLQPDLVHSWLFDANAYGRMAAISVGTRTMVATERAIDTWKTDLEFEIDRQLAKRTARIVVQSNSVREFCIARGMPENKLATVTSGIGPAKSPNPGDRQEFFRELDLPTDVKFIAYVGRLTHRKRLKELIWATDQLKAVGLAAHLLLIGQGPTRRAIERYAWLNRVNDRVHFLGPRDDVPRILACVDVLWQPSATEGQSIAVLEAMAAGIPVVAADAGGNRELVVSGETGYLVPLNERAGFARSTLPILENPTLARQLGAAGQQRASALHKPADMIAHALQPYIANYWRNSFDRR